MCGIARTVIYTRHLYHAMLCIAQTKLKLSKDICLSMGVRHTPALGQNGWMYHQNSSLLDIPINHSTKPCSKISKGYLNGRLKYRCTRKLAIFCFWYCFSSCYQQSSVEFCWSLSARTAFYTVYTRTVTPHSIVTCSVRGQRNVYLRRYLVRMQSICNAHFGLQREILLVVLTIGNNTSGFFVRCFFCF